MTTAAWPHDELVHAWWVRPGQVLAGEYPTDANGGPAKLQVLLDAGLRTFVDLTTAADRLAPYRDVLLALGREQGFPVRHESHPIPDLGTIDLDGYARIVDLIEAEIARSRPIYVHCWGGVGRTGTVIACLIAEKGDSTNEVLSAIGELRAGTRKARHPCPETDSQLQAIDAWLARPAAGG